MVEAAWWNGKRVLVTGGASFIGSHLVDSLLRRGATVRVADDFSSGRLQNLEYELKEEAPGLWVGDRLEVVRGDLRETSLTRQVLKGIEVVFHLAAAHGGRGYIETHPADTASNMALDQIVLREAYLAGVDRFCYASSACVYPKYLQEEAGSSYLLKEEDADPFVRDRAFPDLEYGWAKLMGEMALRAYYRQHGMKTSAVRIFTAYGPRENETHAIIALIAKAYARMDPYEIWGSGQQDRNFTYVTDIVEALIRAAERVTDGTVVNAGREDRITIDRAAELVFEIMGWRPRIIKHDLSKPEGVASRAADLSRARSVLGWEPSVSYRNGFRRTIEWYVRIHDRDSVRRNLERLLWERSASTDHSHGQ
jgi:UDP-glucose 4-epimerase